MATKFASFPVLDRKESSSNMLHFNHPGFTNYVQGLVNIKESLIDPRNVLGKWDRDSVDPCSWAMVTCSPENLVIGLRLNNNSMSGLVPLSLVNMSQLAFLDFSYNNLSGPIQRFPARTFKKSYDLCYWEGARVLWNNTTATFLQLE
ncbi:hypothetical protein IFM89_019611 [Coptis chinensis]|uniref:Leucine-rich repeat-containing N-terminal plant-type domain-containing protein n=1 Tax=Coptis chinensis TaxID=261450 RepID=A0A835M5I4_9MAGN|nr:hypothetical protein IFM89_019611 [Coptis chinensis]